VANFPAQSGLGPRGISSTILKDLPGQED